MAAVLIGPTTKTTTTTTKSLPWRLRYIAVQVNFP
jgi:hypothetical protein